jgi:lipopolysaccharide transport system permease protein
MLGIFWSFLNPLLMLSVYTFVFTEVFRMRWTPTGGANKLEFAVILFAGQLVFTLFAECVGRAPGLIVSNPNYVKRVVFPLEIFTWVSLLTAMFHFCVGLLVLLPVLLYTYGSVPFTALLLPLAILPMALLCAGLGWLLGALGVYVRDIGQIIGLVITALMFLSPLFYPASAVPAAHRWLLDLNPLTMPIESARQLLIFGELPDPLKWSIHLAACAVTAAVGLWVFNRTRRGFSDVL